MKVLPIENNYMPVTRDVMVKPKTAGKEAAINKEMNIPVEDRQEVNDYSGQELEIAVEQLNKTMETYNTELRFTIHKESGQVLVKVINTKDDSVIREIPPERILDFVAHVKEMLGFIFDKFI